MLCFLPPTFFLKVWAAEPMSISLTQTFKPYTYLEDGKWKGIDIEIGRELHQRMGLEVELTALPWARQLAYAKSGEVAGLLTAYCEDERDFLEPTSEHYYKVKASLFARRDVAAKAPIKQLADIPNGARVGVIIENIFNDVLDSRTEIERARSHSSELLPMQLFHRRVDYVLEEFFPFVFYSKQAGVESEFEEVLVMREFKVCAVFSKTHFGDKSTLIAERASRVIKQLKEEGFIDGVIQKYIPSSYLKGQ